MLWFSTLKDSRTLHEYTFVSTIVFVTHFKSNQIQVSLLMGGCHRASTDKNKKKLEKFTPC
jgi:hypothetical protein